jgi:hypothetical protein
MGETVFRIGLGDIQAIRISCKHQGCGGSLELATGKLGEAMGNNQYCPCCRAAWWATASPKSIDRRSPFFDLQELLEWSKQQIGLTIELVVRKAAVE